MKTHWRNGGIASRVLNLGSRWRWVVSLTSRQLYPRYLLDRGCVRPEPVLTRCREKILSLLLPGIKPQSSGP